MKRAAVKRTVIPAARRHVQGLGRNLERGRVKFKVPGAVRVAARRLWWVAPALIAAVLLAEIVLVLWRRPPMG